jgi:membrane protein YqaA with SNARE-associated domain
MFKRLYDWTIRLAESPRATWALAGVSFAESSFFPIPPDVILAPMALAKPRKAWFYATICTISSVLGGIFGYAIGYLLYDTVGQWLIHLYGLSEKAADFHATYDRIGAWIILVKGVTPIPYKLVTIVSGLAHYNFFLFVLLSLITRGARFFILAGILNRFGDPIRGLLERHFAAVMIVVLFFIVAGFWLAANVI